jgi:hypothetical protein
MPAPNLAAHLSCPRCEQSLRQYPDRSWGCGGCGLGFPSLLDIPCLFAEPVATLTEWRGRLQFSLEKLAHEAGELQAELQNPRLRSLTRDRLGLLNRATIDQVKRLRELLAPLSIHQAQAALATHLALQTRLPGDQGLTTYYQNIHRDWAWGEAENEATLRLVGGALPGVEAVDSVLVLGSGAGRLAYDLHQEYAIGLTLALDFNPLLALVARRAMAGEVTELWEFPLAPRTLADNAVLRELVAPQPVREGFQLILGDALRPPLTAGSFDVIVTPWVVDILPEDFRTLAARINVLLKPGGRWICFGSLCFGQRLASQRYSLEETLAIVMDSGFAEPDVREDEIPYMCSPASRHGRIENVLTIVADKERSVAPPPRHRALPDWLVNGTQPVPLLPAFEMQAMTTRIYAFIMGMIDGRRSIRDMARLLVDQRLMSRDEAEPAVRNFLIKMHEDSQR